MKHILIMGDYPLPNETITGGIMRSVYLTANALSHIYPEYDFHVLTITDEIKKPLVVNINNLTVHYIPFSLRNKPILVPKFIYKQMILKYINKINPDLIHANGTSWDYGYPAVAWKKCPVLLTIHGISHNESKYWLGLKGKWHRWNCCNMESYILNKVENIISVSEYVSKSISKNTEIISNPVDPKFFNVKKYPIRNQLLYIGGIEERKGLDVLIKALHIVKMQNPDIRLEVVGSIRSPVYYEYITKLMYEYNLIKNINFVGKVNDEKLMAEYSNTSIYISPSFEESEGITILEAMATGTPVIATRSGGSECVIKDGINGVLVEKDEPVELASAILECEKDIGEAGRMTALKYLPENIARQYMKVYRKYL